MSSSSSRAVVTLREANEYDALLSSSGRNNNNNNNNSRTNRKAPPPSSYGVSSTTTTMEEGGSSSSLHATHLWTQNDENKEEECGSSSDDYSSSHDNNNSHAAAAASSPTRRSKTTCSQWTSFALATLLPLLLIGLSAWLLLIVTRRGATESLFHARYDYIIVGGGPSGIVTVRDIPWNTRTHTRDVCALHSMSCHVTSFIRPFGISHPPPSFSLLHVLLYIYIYIYTHRRPN
jgi:hypothetical protein